MRDRPLTQPPGLHHLAVGDIVVTAINDGNVQASFDLIAGADLRDCERVERAAFRAVPPRMTMNSFLLRLADALVLVDAGSGHTAGPSLGRQLANLAAMGVEPGDIDAVLLTHLHPDHMNGLVDRDGQAVFPRAELVVNEAELQFQNDPASLSRAPAEAHGFFAEAKIALAPYRNRIRTVRDGPVLAGVTAITQPGHTPGHTGWLVESGRDCVLIWGDIVHMPAVQLALPEAGTVLDVDHAQAVATRRRVLEAAATDRHRVAGIHLDFPAFGYIERAGSGYRFVPEVWNVAV